MPRWLAGIALGLPAGLAAQVPRTQVQCNGQVITDVLIRSHAPSYGGLFERSQLLGRGTEVLPRRVDTVAKDGEHAPRFAG